ncbi:MAG: DUF4178 domain-containing protein [Acidobacteria bacterium]|nr:DUF4178 domain-containing protein [Acidobacteriota bacterium]
MSVLKANCPSCGGPVEFTAGSTIVIVCPFCRSVVARTDRGLEDIGKVAEIVDSQSPLRLGLKGSYKGARFELTGRAQMRHELGGSWDEWYATFANGWVGWLAEAQGRFYMTFYQPLPADASLPAFNDLQLGQQVPQIPSASPLMVQERGKATYAAAEGEIPYKLVPGEVFEYADLAGKSGLFATIDYSIEPPWVFLGAQVPLTEIGLGDAKPVIREARTTGSAALSCPNCGGPLALAAPDKAERVTCPNCNSLLDVNQGKLSYFKSLNDVANKPNFVLPIGAEGVFPGDVKFKIIGAMSRSVTIEGVKYFWHEYLLYNPMVGFRWLVHSDDHWSFVESVNMADVTPPAFVGKSQKAIYDGTSFTAFQDAQARVEYVTGEFYWRVEVGETVRAVDFVNAPRMLSEEIAWGEINWSVGTYVPVADVEKIFGVTGLPRPAGVAPNQPFTGTFWYTWGLLPVLALMVIAVVLLPVTGITKTVMSQDLILPPMANQTTPQQLFSDPFEIKANQNIQIAAAAPVSNSWADIDIDLINESGDEVESVNVPIEYYSGSDSDGPWTEGSTITDATVSSIPAGKYTLRIEGTWENWQVQMPVKVKVQQGVNRGVNFCAAFLILLIMPVLGIIRKWSFEASRWKDSMFSGSDSDDD